MAEKEEPKKRLKQTEFKLYGDDWKAAGYPLTMETEILAIRKFIEAKAIHKGERRTLVKAAYNEMRKRQRQAERNMDCGSCMRDMNRQLNIWLKLYDARTTEQNKNITAPAVDTEALELTDIVDGHTDTDDLIKMDDREKAILDMDYWDMLEHGEKVLSPEKINELKNKGNGKVPKKTDLQEALIQLIKNEG